MNPLSFFRRSRRVPALVVTRGTSRAQREYLAKRNALHDRLRAELGRAK